MSVFLDVPFVAASSGRTKSFLSASLTFYHLAFNVLFCKTSGVPGMVNTLTSHFI